MADEEQKKTEQHPEPPTEPPPSAVDNNGNEVKEKDTHANNKSEKGNDENNIHKPVIEKIDKTKGWSKAEIISLIAIIFNFIAIIIATLALLNTQKSVAITKATYKKGLEKDSIQSIRNIIRDSLDYIRREQDYIKDTTNTGLSKNSLDAQITSIKEAQSQFLIGNAPFLQISIPSLIYPAQIGKPLLFNFNITNFGNYPVQILDAKIGHAIRIIPPDFKEIYSGGETYAINTFIVRGFPFNVSTVNKVILSEPQYIAMKSGKYHLFIYGYITYKNLITKDVKEYRFTIKEDVFENLADYIINKNIDK